MGEENQAGMRPTDAVDKAIEASKTGWATNLLGPSSKVLGDLAGKKLDEWINGKRQANIEAHIAAVETKTVAKNATEEPSLSQVSDLAEWEKHAGKYGDDEPEISAIWRSILEKIKANDHRTQQDIDIAKNLSPYQAAELFRFADMQEDHGFIHQDESDQIPYFMEIGIIKKYINLNDVRIKFAQSSAFIFMSLAISLAFGIVRNTPIYREALPSFFIDSYWQLVILIILVGFSPLLAQVNSYLRRSSLVTLTPTGKRTVSIAKRYME